MSVLILGAGQVGSLVAKALYQKGYKNVSVANRTLKTAEKLVKQGYAGNAIDLKEALVSINNFEVIFFALSSVISESMAKKLEIRSGAMLFDLGNPPNTSFFPKNKYIIYAVEHISKFTSFILEERKQKIITAQQLIKKYVKEAETAINNKMVNASRNENLRRFEGEFSQAFIGKIKLKSQFLFLIRSFLIQKEFIEVQTPYVVAVSSDPVRSGGCNELFSVNWYSKKMYLRQSNQLHKQSLILSGFDKIFELGPFWRAEVNPTLRHLSESLGLDVEMLNEKNLKVKDLINFIGEMLGFVTKKLYDEGLIKKKDVLNPVPLIFEYSDICKILKENNIEYEYGTDLGYDIEWKLSEIMQKKHGIDFFAVIHYPNTIKKFYTKDSGKLTETFDIFYRGWELSSGAIRQTDLNKLTEGMKKANLDVDKYRFYLDKFRSNRPHCGFAIGVDRFLTKLIRENNIREFVVYPRSETEIIP